MELEQELTRVDGIGEAAKNRLNSAGITTVPQLASFDAEKLANIKGFDFISSQKIIEAAKTYLAQNNHNSEIDSSEITYTEPTLQKELIESFEQDIQVEDSEIEEEETIVCEQYESDSFNPLDIIDFDEKVALTIPYTENANADLLREKNDSPETRTKSLHEKKKSASIVKSKHKKLMYEYFNGERLSKKDFISLLQTITRSFDNQGYHIIGQQSTMFKRLLKNIDLIALKILESTESTGKLLVFPVKISELRGTLVVSDKGISYNPTNQSDNKDSTFRNIFIKPPLEQLIDASTNIFHNIIHEKMLFQLFNKLLHNRLMIKKTKDKKALFIVAGEKQYEVIVDPLFISISKPAFLEKAIMIAYHRSTNVHVIQYDAVKRSVAFLEEKYALLDSCLKTDPLNNYKKSVIKVRTDLRLYSVFFLVCGLSFFALLSLQDSFIISTLTNLAYAVLAMYFCTLIYFIIRYRKIHHSLNNDFLTPHYQKQLALDETDFLILKDITTSSVLEQFIFEYFGKHNEFSLIPAVELENPLSKSKKISINQMEEIQDTIDFLNEEEEEEEDISMRNPYQTMTKDPKLKEIEKKLTSKYGSFLED